MFADIFKYLDRWLFIFINDTFSNPVFDVIFPFLTDLNQQTVVLILVGLVWISLLIWGGRRGRIVAVGLVIVITLTDQLNSSVLKSIFLRPRPCHLIDGIQNVEWVNLLVHCGSGMSFPSSHAANNAAAAVFLSKYYPQYTWYFAAFALIIGFSRIYVGVHFPIDVLAGFLVGVICGASVIGIFNLIGLIVKKKHNKE